MPPVQDQDQTPFAIKYQAAATPDVIIKAAPGFLHSIIVGEDVSGGIIEVSDHASDGDGNVVIYLKDPDVRVYPIDAEFTTGIAADLTGAQTHVAFVWR